jgi:membrane protein implicated in regulation of membrane protease activity
VFLILALVLLFLLPSPWNLVAFGVGLGLFVCELLLWRRHVRGIRQEVGAETLIGKEATVVSACRPEGQVRVGGEVWAARCAAGVDVGEKVTVDGLDGLTLVVSRATRARTVPPTGAERPS